MKHKNMKWFSLCLALLLVCAGVPAGAQRQTTEISFSIGSRDIYINGVTLQAEPSFTENGTTLVPLRVISEAFGAEVEWWDTTNSVSILLDDCSILLIIGDKTCYVNGTEQKLPAAPVLKNSTTMVPLRFISETFGANVQYNENTHSVVVEYTHVLPGTKLQLSAFGVRLTMPAGWSQKTADSNRLLLENLYSDGTVDFFYILAAETSCSGEEWLKQETAYLQAQYGSTRFQSQSGQSTDENGAWTTLDVAVTYPAWSTTLKERFLAGNDFGYFVRYGRLTPSPQDGAEGDSVAAATGAALQDPGSEPAWDEMEQILESLEITPVTDAEVQTVNPHWNASQHIMNKYDGWQMDLPETFQTLQSETGATLYEQPDGLRLAMVCATNGAPMKFENIVPFYIPLSKSGPVYQGSQIISYSRPTEVFKSYVDAFQTMTTDDLKNAENYVHSEQFILSDEQEYIGGSAYQLVALCFQKDTVRYHSLNYFYVGLSSSYKTTFLAQILMPEETANWLDMDRVYQSLLTFQYSR